MAQHQSTHGRPRGGGYRPRGGQPADIELQAIVLHPLDANLLDGTAKAAARKIAGNKGSNKPTQLRRFYDELCMWEAKVARDETRFEEYLPFIRMLNAKAAYAKGRKLVDENYAALMAHCLRQVKDAATLRTCKLFFEAFMGFYKAERPKD